MSDRVILASSNAVTADDLPLLPSGNEFYLQEVVFEVLQDGTRVARYRYVMPILRQGVEFYEVEADFHYLCETRALRELAESGEDVDQIIVSLADRELEVGEVSSNATQYFEAYRIEDGSCIWEGF